MAGARVAWSVWGVLTASWRSPPLRGHCTWPRVDAGHEDLRTKPAFCASNVWLCACPAGSLVEVNAPGKCFGHDTVGQDRAPRALPAQLRVAPGSGDNNPKVGEIDTAVRLHTRHRTVDAQCESAL